LSALDALSRDDILRQLETPEDRTRLIRDGAEAGVAEAQAVYGQMLLDGAGAARDANAAFGWFWKAAQAGHLMALNMLGRCYDLGWGVPVDKARAAECFRIAAERGLDWGMYNYATALTLGEGVAEDRPAALAWFEQAAALGNAKALNYIGSFHEDGWVVAQDLAIAADCYARAAEGGDFRGMFNHARMLSSAGSIDEALIWIERCAATATPVFREKLFAWLKRAAEPRLRDEGPAALVRGTPC
jgi:TPR repeat protein